VAFALGSAFLGAACAAADDAKADAALSTASAKRLSRLWRGSLSPPSPPPPQPLLPPLPLPLPPPLPPPLSAAAEHAAARRGKWRATTRPFPRQRGVMVESAAMGDKDARRRRTGGVPRRAARAARAPPARGRPGHATALYICVNVVRSVRNAVIR